MLLEVCLLIALFLTLWFVNDNFIAARNYPPGPWRFPLLGTLIQLSLRKHEKPYVMFKNMTKEYGQIFSIQFGTIKQVVVNDPEIIREVIANDNWTDRPYNAFVLDRSYGKHYGLLWGIGEPWKEIRRFSIRTLRDFGFGKKGQEAIMEEELSELLGNLNETLKEGNQVQMSQFFTVSVLNIIWTMIAGTRFSHKDKKFGEFVTRLTKAVTSVSANGTLLMGYPFLRPFIKFLPAAFSERNKLVSSLRDDFQEILTERRQKGVFMKEQNDFVDVFLTQIEKNKHKTSEEIYTDRQFIITVLDLFVAGSETTSNTSEFGILHMMLNPEVQAKVQNEIDRVVGRRRFPSASDRPNMPYTDATILEIQRISTIVPLLGRSPFNDTTVGPYKIPKGTYTIFNTYAVHHSTTIWKDPHLFQPERFLDSDNNIINSEKLLIFGGGKRLCLGDVLAKATVFTYFATMMQNYTFGVPAGFPTPSPHATRHALTTCSEPFVAEIKPREFSS